MEESPPSTEPTSSLESSARRRQRSTFRDFAIRNVWIVGYLALQAFAVAGLVTPRFVDSQGYLHLSFTGTADRLFTVPLLYTLLPTDPLRVAGQVLLATVAWWVLASTAASFVFHRWLRLGLRLVLLALGLTGPIISWNSTILSESAAISLTALLIAAWLAYVRSPSRPLAAIGVLVTLLWTFVRQDQVILCALIAAVAVVIAIRHRRPRTNIAVAVLLVAISVLGFVSSDRNHSAIDVSIADIVQGRILTNPSYLAWFQAHGMPYTSTMAKAAGGYPATPLLHDPTFDPWLIDHGEATYIEFVLAHPRYALWEPLADVGGEPSSLSTQTTSPTPTLQPEPTPSLLSPTVAYGRHRQVLPTVIEIFLFEQGQIGDLVVLITATGAVMFVLWRRRALSRIDVVPGIVVLSAVPQFYAVWLGDLLELDRHAMVLAVSFRIGLWTLLAFGLDRLLLDRERGIPMWSTARPPRSRNRHQFPGARSGAGAQPSEPAPE